MKEKYKEYFPVFIIAIIFDFVFWNIVDRDFLSILASSNSWLRLLLHSTASIIEPILLCIISLYLCNFCTNHLQAKKYKSAYIGGLFLIISFLLSYGVSLLEKLIFADNQHVGIESFFCTSTISVYVIFSFWIIQKRKQEQQIERIRLLNAEAQISLKQSEINKLSIKTDNHFILNELSSLYSMIDIDTNKAKEYLATLIAFYRYLVINAEKDLIPLEEELNFSKLFASYIQLTHKDELHISFDSSLNSKFPGLFVPPVSVQSLISNAIKHNAKLPDRPLIIKVFLSGNKICVSNNYQPVEVINESHGQGLQLLKDRCKLLYGGQVETENDEKEFKVSFTVYNSLQQ